MDSNGVQFVAFNLEILQVLQTNKGPGFDAFYLTIAQLQIRQRCQIDESVILDFLNRVLAQDQSSQQRKVLECPEKKVFFFNQRNNSLSIRYFLEGNALRLSSKFNYHSMCFFLTRKKLSKCII